MAGEHFSPSPIFWLRARCTLLIGSTAWRLIPLVAAMSRAPRLAFVKAHPDQMAHFAAAD